MVSIQLIISVCEKVASDIEYHYFQKETMMTTADIVALKHCGINKMRIDIGNDMMIDTYISGVYYDESKGFVICVSKNFDGKKEAKDLIHKIETYELFTKTEA